MNKPKTIILLLLIILMIIGSIYMQNIWISDYHFTIYSVFFLAAALVSFFVAFLAWQRLSIKGAGELASLMIASGIWAFWIIFETAAPAMPEKIFWSKLCYFGAVSAPVLYFIFVLRFTGKAKFISTKNILLLFIIPLITLALAITNEKHLLIWSGFSAISAKNNIMEYYHGIWYWIGYVGYSYLLLLLSTIYLFSFISRHNKTFRSQGLIVFIAGLCPWTASVIYISGSNPVPGLDITPVSIILSGTLLVFAILYMRFLDIVPVARETLVETLPDGIMALDGQNRIQDINEAALSFLGIQNKNIIGFPAESSGASDTLLLNAVIDKELIDQIEIKTSDEIKTFKIIKKTIKNYPDSRLVVIHDITDLKRVEDALRESEEKHRLLIENSHDIIYMLTSDGIFTFVSPAWTTLLGHSISQVVDKSFVLFVHPDDIPGCMLWLQKVIETGQRQEGVEYRVRHIDGSWFWHTSSAVPLRSEAGTVIGFEGTARDITERKQAEDALRLEQKLLSQAQKELEETNSKLKELNLQLEKLSTVDELSGLYNRRYFDSTLSKEFSRHRRNIKPLSLIMCDIDYFKNYNDILGHQAGDRCIQLVAGALTKVATRPSDTVARYGGEEFVVILPQTDESGCKKVAELIQKEIHKMLLPHPDSAVSSTITLSFGVTTIIPDDTIKPEDVIELADKALYDSKSKGRDQISIRLRE
jgi:diguanylate cyclase (GGDEF)-like protein/PAS domain S-box-containing protein